MGVMMLWGGGVEEFKGYLKGGLEAVGLFYPVDTTKTKILT